MPATGDSVIWHDVECGAYTADLPLWRELADEASGSVLELGAGTGRVALDLAERGHDVTALDSDAELLDELEERAETRGVDVRRVTADARSLAPFGAYALVLAPMQFVQIMGGRSARGELLGAVAALLSPDGRFAAALAELDDAVASEDAAPPLPDVAERQGWVYSSLPTGIRPHPGGIALERLRQVVSPAGELRDERHTQLLDALSADALEAEARVLGLVPEARRKVGATGQHVGSTVVVCRR
jgi:SAM-dependent methyltransferase